MTKQEKREWKAEKKLRKAVKKYAKAHPAMTEMITHTHANGKTFLIQIKMLERYG